MHKFNFISGGGVPIEIVYQTEYFMRELFLLKIKNKYLMVYKSSGLNGSEPGTVLPFLYLKDDTSQRFSEVMAGISTGYIYKEMLYNGQLKQHYKKFDDEKLIQFLNHLTIELSKVIVPKNNYDIYDIEKVAKKINSEMKEIIGNSTFIKNTFDLYLDLKSITF